MEEEEERDEAQRERQDERFRMPEPPPMPPTPPRLNVQLPRHPDVPRESGIEPGSYGKAALASTAASSLIMPIIVLGVGGWLLDTKLHHNTFWLAFLGVIIGLVVGVSALLRVVKKLED